jgi:hypothetical protein
MRRMITMNCEAEKKYFDVCIEASRTVSRRLEAENAEEARRMVSCAFGFANGYDTHMAIHHLQDQLEILNEDFLEAPVEEMECTISNEVVITGTDGEDANESHQSTVVIRAEEVSEEDEDEEIDFCLMYLLDKEPELIPFDQLDEYADTFGEKPQAEEIGDTGCEIYYNPNAVLAVEGDRYLIGPAVVYAVEDDEAEPMTDAEIAETVKVLKDRTVRLCVDHEAFYALKLFEEV